MEDALNRSTVKALMTSLGIDGFAELGRRMEHASGKTFERSYVSRVMRSQRPAQPSFIVAVAQALKVPTIAITGTGVDITLSDQLEATA